MKTRFSDIININKKKSGIAFCTIFALLIVFCGSWAGSVFAASSEQEADLEGMGELQSHGNGELAWPVPDFYTISSGYGYRFGGTDFHTGIDITGKDIYGASVIAAEDGTVAFVQTDYSPGVGYGMYLIIEHDNNLSTLYSQLSEILVKEGDKVEKGQVIANVGSTGFSTGPHLSFEVRESGAHVDPVPYLMPIDEDL